MSQDMYEEVRVEEGWEGGREGDMRGASELELCRQSDRRGRGFGEL